MPTGPLPASTTPASGRWPTPARIAAANVSSVPATVTWLGVMGSRLSRPAARWALRLTHAWKRVVNTRLDLLAGGPRLPHLLVHLDQPRRDRLPGVALGLGEAGVAEAAAEQPVARQHGQRGAELDGPLRLHGQAVDPGLEHGE